MDQTVTRAELRHPAKFRWNRWNCGRDMAIFQNDGCRHVGFLKLQIVERIISVELHYHANVCGYRSNHCRYISIYFGFNKMDTATILDF